VRKVLILTTALLCPLLLSCTWFGSQADLRISIPQPPEHWVRAFPDLTFVVVFPDTGGWRRVIATDISQPTVITCVKAGNTPILAYPVSAGSIGFLRPAGGLFPMDCVDFGEPPHLALSWQDGCLALIFKMLAERGFDTSLVNAARLASFVDRHADPWALDLDAIAERLILGDFSAFDIDLLPTREVTVRPGAGEWFLESPCASPRSVMDEAEITFPRLSIGMHMLFSVEGRRVGIWVGETETVIGREASTHTRN